MKLLLMIVFMMQVASTISYCSLHCSGFHPLKVTYNARSLIEELHQQLGKTNNPLKLLLQVQVYAQVFQIEIKDIYKILYIYIYNTQKIFSYLRTIISENLPKVIFLLIIWLHGKKIFT